MSVIKFLRISVLLLASLFLVACQLQDLGKRLNFETSENSAAFLDENPMPLRDILDNSLANENPGTDFLASIKHALDTDPEITSKRLEVESKLASVEVAEAQKDFQVGATFYGGIEDVTDNTKGLAVAINASRLLFDSGKLDAQITSSLFEVEAARMDLRATLDKRAYELFVKWLELEKYKSLKGQIDKRLSVLNPLIDQLERIAEAGIGDLSKVTAAQRTVSSIRVEQTSVVEGLSQAQLNFTNAFGVLDNEITFEYTFVSNLVPNEIDNSVVQNSPALKSQYASYQSSLATVKALRAKDGFNVGFEAAAMRPFAGSEHGSDESIGLVGRKTLFNRGMLEAEIKEAEARAQSRLDKIKVTYRSGVKSVRAAKQNIESMEKAILLARENARLTSDEIVHLRQQLVIGGSTLESVLSAEARLYEAESKEINFLTEKYKSEALIASSLGILSGALGY